ncbi:MAG: M23 family metallopeptidase [Deltaproteobacteria bacterium]|nr:M23 family metallopeptidase [Deltaproteobacteria bacterium]
MIKNRKIHFSVFVLLLAVTILSSCFVWLYYLRADRLRSANDYYLRERNGILREMAGVYYILARTEEILGQLGLSAEQFQRRLLSDLTDDSTSFRQASLQKAAALLLTEQTPLEIGTTIMRPISPQIKSYGETILRKAHNLGKIFDQSRISLRFIPSIFPVLGRLKSLYGWRVHPIHASRQFHKGIDIAAQNGTSVVATADGEVVFAGKEGGYGQSILIAHSALFKTRYSHLGGIRVGLRQRIRRGDVIGVVGSSGQSTGPHLHYEVHVHGQPKDPIRFIFN